MLCAILLALPLAGAPAAPPQERALERTLEELAGWVRAYERRGEPWLLEHEGELRAHLAALSGAAPADPEAVVPALLDVAAVRTAHEALLAGDDPVPEQVGEASARVRRLAVRALRDAWADDAAVPAWIGRAVLASSAHPIGRRVAAARALAGQRRAETRLALFTAAQSGERALRQAASEALVGWRHEAVHAFLADQLLRWAADPTWVEPGPLLVHFERAWIPPEGRAAAAIEADLARVLASDDWRAAARALRVAPAFDDRAAAPALIGALEVWAARPGDPGARRIAADLTGALERRSGRRIGAHPDRWRTWWDGVRAGRIDPGAAPAGAARTRAAGFFGLHPETNRVTFVLDRSGSMDFAGGTDGDSRHQRAVAELVAFLEALGPTTRFRIVVFNTGVRTWGDRMPRATQRNIGAARSWLLANRPNGGTRLAPAVRAALFADERGRVDFDRLDTDTVIVLCDGETEEGPGWVGPFLEAVRDATCVRFHGVQVGGVGDGTLARLADGTGGRLVQVR